MCAYKGIVFKTKVIQKFILRFLLFAKKKKKLFFQKLIWEMVSASMSLFWKTLFNINNCRLQAIPYWYSECGGGVRGGGGSRGVRGGRLCPWILYAIQCVNYFLPLFSLLKMNLTKSLLVSLKQYILIQFRIFLIFHCW